MCICVSYLEGESVLAGAEPHVLHGGAGDHHLSHISAGHKHWAAGLIRKEVRSLEKMYITHNLFTERKGIHDLFSENVS